MMEIEQSNKSFLLDKEMVESLKWGLILAMRNRARGTFKRAGLKEVTFPSIEVSMEELLKIRTFKDLNQTYFTINCNIIDSENNEIIAKEINIDFSMDLDEFADDCYRFHFRSIDN